MTNGRDPPGRDRPPDPCPPPRPPTSGSLGVASLSGGVREGSLRRGRTLTTGYVRQKEEIFDFAELVKEMIPIDPIRRLATWSEAGGGQATKGTGWMPWRQEPMKDVAGCEKLRGVASRQ